MMIKKILAALLAALMLFCTAACAETEDAFAEGGDFNYDFADDGYDGEWVEVSALSMEFCQPDGWTAVEPGKGASYAAASADGMASLSIRLAAEGVEDVTAWGEANLDGYEMDEANFYDVLVVETDGAISIYADVSEGGLIAFDFTRADAEALSRTFALQIVGSACALWDDADVLVGDGDIEGFDFGEAFEEDLG